MQSTTDPCSLFLLISNHFAVASKKRKITLFRFSAIITSDCSYFADLFALFWLILQLPWWIWWKSTEPFCRTLSIYNLAGKTNNCWQCIHSVFCIQPSNRVPSLIPCFPSLSIHNVHSLLLLCAQLIYMQCILGRNGAFFTFITCLFYSNVTRRVTWRHRTNFTLFGKICKK